MDLSLDVPVSMEPPLGLGSCIRGLLPQCSGLFFQLWIRSVVPVAPHSTEAHWFQLSICDLGFVGSGGKRIAPVWAYINWSMREDHAHDLLFVFV